VARRRMVIRKLDPYSVLKFGALANLAIAAIGFVALSIVIRVALGSGVVGEVCEIAGDVGFLGCSVSQGRITRLLIVLALVWAVVQTALLVLLAFLHNLVADLTGGIAITMEIETPPGARAAGDGPNGGPGGSSGGPSGGVSGGSGPTGRGGPAATTPAPVVARPGPAGPNDQTTTVETVDAIEAVVQAKPRRKGADGGRLFDARS
jgi:uncharacterized membrane protein YgcG